MPAVSDAQRRYLNARFGHAWVKKHHFDNEGPLPEHAGHTPDKSRGHRAHDTKHHRRKGS